MSDGECSRFELMRHALGVHRYGLRWRKPYRNYFCAAGDHVVIWDALVADGLAHVSGPYPTYSCTEAGRAAALDGIVFKRVWGTGKPVNP